MEDGRLHTKLALRLKVQHPSSPSEDGQETEQPPVSPTVEQQLTEAQNRLEIANDEKKSQREKLATWERLYESLKSSHADARDEARSLRKEAREHWADLKKYIEEARVSRTETAVRKDALRKVQQENLELRQGVQMLHILAGNILSPKKE